MVKKRIGSFSCAKDYEQPGRQSDFLQCLPSKLSIMEWPSRLVAMRSFHDRSRSSRDRSPIYLHTKSRSLKQVVIHQGKSENGRTKHGQEGENEQLPLVPSLEQPRRSLTLLHCSRH
ncbi:hypothetical protein AVEN_181560-1 [Araneus ventricosus]|uniref:Uncharacterized protein n=1 Tax=Araneus ventricosus TaxID=182803 RepID=A0A4Y2E548_ARAVE|nr:hypothetical protein AVEN_181560-1 [Araneus ventricosus]